VPSWVTFCIELPFRRYFTLKVRTIYSVRLCCFGTMVYLQAVSKRCTVYMQQIARTVEYADADPRSQIRGLTADRILLQASAYIAVIIIETRATQRLVDEVVTFCANKSVNTTDLTVNVTKLLTPSSLTISTFIILRRNKPND